MSTAVAVPRTVPQALQAVLHPDEIIILLIRPSPLYIALSSFGTLVAAAIGALVLAYAAQFQWSPWTDVHAAAFGIGLAGMRLAWGWLDWINHAYVLTASASIQNTIVVQSMRERLCFLGTLGFATAGRGTFDAFWESIATPFDVHRKVLEAIERHRR